MSALLTPRWTPLRHHPVQQAYWRSRHRFNTVPAGRRSGKTELAKRKLVKACMRAFQSWAPRYFAGAPTRDQAKRIYWEDLKALTPRNVLADRPSESDLMIPYITGAQLWVIGMDKPERIEGSPWDGGVLDEYGNMKEGAWGANVRPALSDRRGWCDFIGVPEGRNHYYDLDRKAKADQKANGEDAEWGSYAWPSADILPPEEIEAAKRDLDAMTFDQEYNASFINFEGRAYYPFTEESHTAVLTYNHKAPLILCFDFNVEPGVAAIIQEQLLPHTYEHDAHGLAILNRPVIGTGVIDEVHIPRNSNTPAVCRKIIEKYGKHTGYVRCYGDATGGNRGTAKVTGSDWDLIKAELAPVFGDRISFRVKTANPKERARINAVNSRLRTMNGTVKMLVDPVKAPYVVKDFEGTPLLKGGSGEIDKKKSPTLSHVSDAIGYYVEYEFPVTDRGVVIERLGGV